MELDVRLRISVKLVGLINASTEVDLYLPHLKKSIVISVPNSISKKDTLRLKGMGNISPDGEKGNLYLEFDNIDNSNVYYKAGTCSNCGHELAHGAEYCFKCGSKVGESNKSNNQRHQRWAGELVKCQYCNEDIPSFVVECPACGRELRGASATSSVKKFYDEYKNEVNNDIKENIIRSFPIPNTKEDIYEFIIQASSEIKTSNNDDLRNAWYSKLEQAYKKARLMFKEGSPEFTSIADMYNEAKLIIESIEKARNQERLNEERARNQEKRNADKAAIREAKRKQRSQNIKNVGNFLSSVVDVFSELLPIMPNLLLSTIWLATLFFLIPICVADPTYEFIFVLDLVLGALLAPLALRCDSHTPRIITILGLVLSIIILIIVYKEFEVVIFFDIVCSAVVIFRMFRKRSDDYQSVDEKASVIAIISTIILLLIIFGISSIRAHFIEPDKSTSTSSIVSEESFNWMTTGLSTYLPAINSTGGLVLENSTTKLSVIVDDISDSKYEEYISQCKNMGYTVEAVKDTNEYRAYNEEGYYLELSHYGSMYINLMVPISGDADFKWPDSSLATLIPKLQNPKGSITTDTEEILKFSVCDISDEDFKSYISLCEAKGFTVDTEKEGNSFNGFTVDGYKLTLQLDSVKVMAVSVETPMEMSEFNWPKSTITKSLPKPKSNLGNITTDRDNSFEIYVGETSIDDFNDYVDKCIKKDYDIDYSREDKSFSGKNKKGDSLRIEYQGCNVMHIEIYNY